MKPTRTFLSLLLLLAVLLAACSPASPAATTTGTPVPSNQSIINTSVAATVAGLSTEVASLKKTNAAPTATPQGTVTPNGTPSTANQNPLTQATTAATHTAGLCDFAAFVSDLSIPDGSVIPPNQKFTKTWAIRNTGTCTWTPKYEMFYTGGDLMGASEVMPLTQANILPGQTANISIEFTAPNDMALHSSFWKFRNPDGGIFGVADASGKETPIWVNIRTSKNYSFTDNLCLAAWMAGGDQQLPCPGSAEDLSGSAFTTTTAQLEDGKFYNLPVLAMMPPPGNQTVITGQYPTNIVPQWAHLKTSVGCAAKKENCNAHVKVDYSVDGGPEQQLWAQDIVFDKKLTSIDIMLGKFSLFNKPVSFIFYVMANGDAADDTIYFVNPRLEP